MERQGSAIWLNPLDCDLIWGRFLRKKTKGDETSPQRFGRTCSQRNQYQHAFVSTRENLTESGPGENLRTVKGPYFIPDIVRRLEASRWPLYWAMEWNREGKCTSGDALTQSITLLLSQPLLSTRNVSPI